MLLQGGILFALLIGLIVWLITASALWTVIAIVLVVCLGGGGYYSRRW